MLSVCVCLENPAPHPLRFEPQVLRRFERRHDIPLLIGAPADH